MVSALEKMPDLSLKWDGTRWSERPLLARRTPCKCSMETSRNFGNKDKVGNKVQIGNKVTI